MRLPFMFLKKVPTFFQISKETTKQGQIKNPRTIDKSTFLGFSLSLFKKRFY